MLLTNQEQKMWITYQELALHIDSSCKNKCDDYGEGFSMNEDAIDSLQSLSGTEKRILEQQHSKKMKRRTKSGGWGSRSTELIILYMSIDIS